MLSLEPASGGVAPWSWLALLRWMGARRATHACQSLCCFVARAWGMPYAVRKLSSAWVWGGEAHRVCDCLSAPSFPYPHPPPPLGPPSTEP